MIPQRKIGDKVVCPYCRKTFTLTESHKFIRYEDFVCSWDCFIKEPKEDMPCVNFNTPEEPIISVLSEEEKRREYYREYYRRKKAKTRA